MNTLHVGLEVGPEVEERSGLECRESCNTIQDCQFWTWSLNSGLCKKFKDVTVPPIDRKNLISGFKVCEGLH